MKKNVNSRAKVMKGSKKFSEILAVELKDPKFKKAYDKHLLEAVVAEQLYALREKKHMTQKQLGDSVGMKQTAIARIEAGKQNLSLDTIVKLAGALGAEVDFSLRASA